LVLYNSDGVTTKLMSKESDKETTQAFCPHTDLDYGPDHQPVLEGCESGWLQQFVNDYASANVRELKVLIDLLGLQDKRQVEAIKRSVNDIIFRHAKAHNDQLWQCTPEGKKWIDPHCEQTVEPPNHLHDGDCGHPTDKTNG